MGARLGEGSTNKKIDGQTRYVSPLSMGHTDKSSWIKICRGCGLHDVITCAKCHFNRFIGDWAVGGGVENRISRRKANPPSTLCLALPRCTWQIVMLLMQWQYRYRDALLSRPTMITLTYILSICMSGTARHRAVLSGTARYHAAKSQRYRALYEHALAVWYC